MAWRSGDQRLRDVNTGSGWSHTAHVSSIGQRDTRAAIEALDHSFCVRVWRSAELLDAAPALSWSSSRSHAPFSLSSGPNSPNITLLFISVRSSPQSIIRHQKMWIIDRRFFRCPTPYLKASHMRSQTVILCSVITLLYNNNIWSFMMFLCPFGA